MRIFRDGEWQTMPATDAALEQLTGWPLPLDLLPWWVRGIPAPTVKPMTFELADERLARVPGDGHADDVRDGVQHDVDERHGDAGRRALGAHPYRSPGI